MRDDIHCIRHTVQDWRRNPQESRKGGGRMRLNACVEGAALGILEERPGFCLPRVSFQGVLRSGVASRQYTLVQTTKARHYVSGFYCCRTTRLQIQKS